LALKILSWTEVSAMVKHSMLWLYVAFLDTDDEVKKGRVFQAGAIFANKARAYPSKPPYAALLYDYF
jgi:hypothetical protein